MCANKQASQYKYKFTVFTPTYNRARTIHRVYDSLCKQTFRDFEWLIVDGGSVDETDELIEKWKLEADFPIRYIDQKNKDARVFKHVAFNIGVREAQGELFLSADSDDAFVSDALEIFNDYWEDIPKTKRNLFTGVTSLCTDQHGVLMGDRFPHSPFDSNAEEIFYRYKVKGEKWGFNRTDVLKEFPFPEPPGIKFILEGYVWFRIAKKYQARFINKSLRIYYYDAVNRLSDRSPFVVAPAKIFYADNINLSINWLWYAPYTFWRTAIIYVRLSILAGDSIFTQLTRLKSIKAKILWFFAVIPGCLVALKDICKYRNKKYVN